MDGVGCGAGRRDGSREGRDQRRRMEGGKRLAGPGRGWEKVGICSLFDGNSSTQP